MIKPILLFSPKTNAVLFQKKAKRRQDIAPMVKIIYIARTYVNWLGNFHFPSIKIIGATWAICVVAFIKN